MTEGTGFEHWQTSETSPALPLEVDVPNRNNLRTVRSPLTDNDGCLEKLPDLPIDVVFEVRLSDGVAFGDILGDSSYLRFSAISCHPISYHLLERASAFEHFS